MKCTSKRLTWACLFCGGVSVITLSLAVSTDKWIFTREKRNMMDIIDVDMGNHTELLPEGMEIEEHEGIEEYEDFGEHEEIEHSLPTFDSYIGLWRICGIVDEEQLQETRTNPCVGIIYMEDGVEGRIEDQFSSGAITRAIRPAAPMVVIALVFVLIAVAFSVVGNLKRDVKVLIAAVFYILAGLSLAVGIVLYISAINDEVGHISKQPDSEEVIFQYHYEWSFYMAGVGFISAEVAAVFNVSLYLKRYSTKKELLKILPGLEEKLDCQTLMENSSPLHSPTLIL